MEQWRRHLRRQCARLIVAKILRLDAANTGDTSAMAEPWVRFQSKSLASSLWVLEISGKDSAARIAA
jgi:hypothetical protein